MTNSLSSSAPRIYSASRWVGDVMLFERDPAVTVGVRRQSPGQASVVHASDELCYFVGGRGTFRRDSGEVVDVEPGTVVHFKEGWTGTVDVDTALDCSFVRARGQEGVGDRTPVLRGALTAGPLTEWGAISTMVVGQSHTAGILLSREAGRRLETGIWTCTPGTWRLRVSQDEFCHFIDGHCVYYHESGETIEIQPDTLAVFPAGWTGVCEVERNMRKVYMIV